MSRSIENIFSLVISYTSTTIAIGSEKNERYFLNCNNIHLSKGAKLYSSNGIAIKISLQSVFKRFNKINISLTLPQSKIGGRKEMFTVNISITNWFFKTNVVNI